MEHDLILYQFSRSKVERGDFGHFLSLYAPNKLPTGPRLRDMMNRFVFCIEGYDSDPREIHSIQEVRRFYSAFHEAWPYWLYFCNLDMGDETLRMLVLCCLPSITAMQVDGQPKVAITYAPPRPAELHQAGFHADERHVRPGGNVRARDLRPEQRGL